MANTAEMHEERQRLIHEIRNTALKIKGQGDLTRNWRGPRPVPNSPKEQKIKDKIDQGDVVFVTTIPEAGLRFDKYHVNGHALAITSEMTVFNAADTLMRYQQFGSRAYQGTNLRVSTDADVAEWKETQKRQHAEIIKAETARINKSRLRGGVLDLVTEKDLANASS